MTRRPRQTVPRPADPWVRPDDLDRADALRRALAARRVPVDAPCAVCDARPCAPGCPLGPTAP